MSKAFKDILLLIIGGFILNAALSLFMLSVETGGFNDRFDCRLTHSVRYCDNADLSY